MKELKELKEMREFYEGNILNAKDVNEGSTAIVVVDMINGFVNEGNFASDRVKAMAPNIVSLLGKFKGCHKVFFRDCHTEDSKEFEAYITHCVDEKETLVIDELKCYLEEEHSVEVSKNSTNGFLAKGFQDWLIENPNIENYIVVGCVTDICVNDFARTLQCYIHENNLNKKVIVPINCVETYEYAPHYAGVLEITTLYGMKLAGINVVDFIK